MNTKNLIIAVLVIAVLVIGGIAITNKEMVVETVGSAAGPLMPWDYYGVGGVVQNKAVFPSMQAATSTLCWFDPSNAGLTGTTTLERVSFQIDTGTSTAATIVIATSTSRYATSTTDVLGTNTVASGNKGTFSYNASGANTNLIGPGDFLLVKTVGVGLGGYTFGGHCQATFEDASELR